MRWNRIEEIEFLPTPADLEVADRRLYDDSSRIVLKNGEQLELEDSADVGDDHDGVLILGGEEVEPVYLAWDEVRRIDFD